MLTPANSVVNTNSTFSSEITATYPFQSNGSRSFVWYKTDCDEFKMSGGIDAVGSASNSSTRQFYATGDIVKVKVQAIDNGCKSKFSNESKIIFRSCLTVNSGCNQSEANYDDLNACTENAQKRVDHHIYTVESVVCEHNCPTLDEFWMQYKSHLSNQVPIQTDEFLFLGRLLPSNLNIILSRILFPEQNFSSPITNSCSQVRLPRPISFIRTLGIYTGNVVFDIGIRSFNNFDPVFVKVDDASKTMVNYTLPGHVFYPGKVSRRIVKECGKIKIVTIGEGTTVLGDNTIGRIWGATNEFVGESIFRNIDSRIKSQIGNKLGKVNIRANTVLSILPPIVNKNWRIKEFKIKYSENDKIFSVFSRSDTINFWNMKNVNIYFSNTGKYNSLDVLNGTSGGNWGFDSISNRLYIDTISAEIIAVNSSQFTLKGQMPVYYDSIIKQATYFITFEESNGSKPLLKPKIGNDTTAYIVCNGETTDISKYYDTTAVIQQWNIADVHRAPVGTYRLIVSNYAGLKDTAIITVKQDVNFWKGSNDFNWDNPLNWSTGKVPTEKTHVIIDGIKPYYCILSRPVAGVASIQVKNKGRISFQNNTGAIRVLSNCHPLPKN
jgi:hypothetical protein